MELGLDYAALSVLFKKIGDPPRAKENLAGAIDIIK
jgi:hypothetical protein